MKDIFSKGTIALLTALITTVNIWAYDVLSLEGAWNLKWGGKADGYVMLPGSMLTNGKGEDVSVNTQWTGSLYDSSFYFNPFMEKYRHEGQMKFPFFLTPKKYYVGEATYSRSVYLPREWKKKRVVLFLERPHIETTVFINGKEAGHQMSLSVPHEYDVTRLLKFGSKNEIVIRVYNGIENVGVGQDSHSVTDQTQGNWNGIAGRIELQAHDKKLNIKSVSIRPDIKKKEVEVIVRVQNHTDGLRIMPTKEYGIEVTAESEKGRPSMSSDYKWDVTGSKFRFRLKFNDGALKLWDEFSPNLYDLTVVAGEETYQTKFGFREIKTEGRKIMLNGRELLLRGTVENCNFPLTGYPPTDKDEWLRIFRKCKEYGLNHMRFHSYCPPEAAFAAADEVGIYLQPEGPTWPNHGVRLRRGMIIDKYLLEESKRIIDTYGHHPSFVMMAAGNEPAGDWVKYCDEWVKEMKDYDPSKIYCGASVGGGWAWDGGSDYHVKGGARGLDWDRRAPQSSDDYQEGIEFPRNYKDKKPNNSPIVAHEKGQWCAFPDLNETSQYTGVYKAENFNIFRDLLRENGMEEMAEKFLMASGRLQTLCYKYEMERNLRTPDYSGFQLLGLNDYSGQGTALVGILNVFWREKPYTDRQAWRQSCSPLVALARFPRFIYTDSDTLRVPIEAYNAFAKKITAANITWNMVNDLGDVVAEGTLNDNAEMNFGKNNPIGTIVQPLKGIKTPTKLTLRVMLSGLEWNKWDVWVYGSLTPDPSPRGEGSSHNSVYVCDSLDEKAKDVLRQGGKVLLTAAGRVTLGSDVKQTYLPVFWNTSWFKMRPPHTTGAYIDKKHPLFRHGFPTDDWANLNWWELFNKAQVMNLRELPRNYQSPIQPIDTWHVSRKLGMIVEARVLGGRLLMTTMDIKRDLAHRHVARQMRHALLDYMESEDFQPSLELTPEVITHFFTEQAPPVNMFTNDSPDELKPKIGA